MRRVLSIGVAISLVVFASPALATLHGWCGAGTISLCLDNGTNSPSAMNPPNPFGFTSSPPGETGTLSIAVLVPDNENAGLSAPLISGAASAMANLFSTTPWINGDLSTYLGLNASPTNPIGAFLPSTQALDPGATGFFVYVGDVGTQTFAGPSGPPNQLFDITPLPLASYIVGFVDMGPNGIEATANSGAILLTVPGFNVVPEPSTLVLLGSALAGLGFVLWRRSRSA